MSIQYLKIWEDKLLNLVFLIKEIQHKEKYNINLIYTITSKLKLHQIITTNLTIHNNFITRRYNNIFTTQI